MTDVYVEIGPGLQTADLVGDTSPQLSGNLDVQTYSITTSTSNGGIVLSPNGTGDITLGTMVFDADQTIGAGQDNYILTYDNGVGKISLEAGGTTGYHYSGTITAAPTGTGEDTIVIGDGAVGNTATKSIVMGYQAALGTGATDGNVVLGELAKINTSTTCIDNVVIGTNAGYSSGNKSFFSNVFIGSDANPHSVSYSDCTYDTVIGYFAKIQGKYGVSLGYDANVGTSSTSYDNAVAIGSSSRSRGLSSVALGYSSQAYGTSSICIGDGNAGATDSIAIGTSTNVDTAGTQTICIGKSATLGGTKNSICLAPDNLSSHIGQGGIGNHNSSQIGIGSYVSAGGEISFACGSFESAGNESDNPKVGHQLLWYETSDATQTTLGCNTNTNGYTTTPTGNFTIQDHTVNRITGTILATRSGCTNSTAFNFELFVKRTGTGVADVAIIGTPTITQDFDDSSSLTTGSIAFAANTSTGSLDIKVTGIAATTIRWLADCKFTVLGFPT